MRLFSLKPIIVISALMVLMSCGGGGGGGDNSLATSGNGPSATIENIPNFGIEPFWNINSSDPDYLYLATSAAIIEVNKHTWAKRTIIGNTYEGVYPNDRQSVSVSSNIQLFDGNVYAGTSSGRVVSGFTGPDQFESVNLYLPVMPGTINGLDYATITSNSTTLYYGGSGGIYAKTYDTMDAPMLLYPKSHFNAIATDGALYVITYTLEGPHYYLMKYDLSSRQSTTIRSDLTPRPGGTGVEVFPMTRSGASIYWVNDGCSFYKLDVNSGSTSFVTTVNLCDIQEIIADDNYLYARNWNEIDKVSLATGATTTIPTHEPVWSFAVDDGKIYYTTGYSGFQIKMIDESQQISTVLDLSGQALGNSSIYLIKVAASNGKLIITTGEKVFIYDIASQALESITTRTGYVTWVRSGKIYTGYRELVTIPIDKKIRPVTEIYPAYYDVDPNSPSSVVATAIDANSIYWITRGWSYYRISKAAHDGSSYQQLYEGSEELRDLALHNGKLFFTCYADCGDPGWVLASMPATGGTPTPEFGLLGDPLTYHKNGIFYVVDTYNFSSRSLYAINIEASDYKELLSNLYYDYQTPRNVIVDASSKWLYVEQYKMQNGPPLANRYRYALNAWNSIGSGQKIDDGFSAMSTDGKYLYFWGDNGLKRVAE